MQAPGRPLHFLVQFLRQTVAEFGEELLHAVEFRRPVSGIDTQQALDLFAGNLQAVERERLRRRHEADRRFLRLGGAVDAVEHPLQHADVFAEAGPQELSVVVAAEPVDVEDMRRVSESLAIWSQ
jgi:hypothetical protein